MQQMKTNVKYVGGISAAPLDANERTHLNLRPAYTGYEAAYFAFTETLIREMFILISSSREIKRWKIKLQQF